MFYTYQDVGKYQFFSDGLITNAVHVRYDPIFRKEDAFIFQVRNGTGEEYVVEIPITEFLSKKILPKFQIQGHLSFYGRLSNTKKEAFVNFLLQRPRTEIFVPYHNEWQINFGEKVCYLASSNKKDCLDYHYPLGWKFLAPVSDNSCTALNQLFDIFQQPTTPLILTLWLHYGMMYTFFEAAHGEIHKPLYLIGKNDLSIEMVQYILQIFDCEHPHMISLSKSDKEITKYLFDAQDEVVVLQDTENDKEKNKRDKNFSLLIEAIDKRETLCVNNQYRYFKAAAVVFGNHYPKDIEDLLILDLSDDSPDLKKWHDLGQQGFFFSEYASLFIRQIEANAQQVQNCIKEKLSIRLKESTEFLETLSLQRAYAALAATADIMRSLLPPQIIGGNRVASALKNAPAIIKEFLFVNENYREFSGMSLILRKALRQSIEREQYMLVDLQSENYDIENSSLPIYYDEKNIYLTRQQLQELTKEAKINIPISRILNSLLQSGYLSCYNLNKPTYYRKIDVTLPCGIQERINVAAISRKLIESDGDLPLLP